MTWENEKGLKLSGGRHNWKVDRRDVAIVIRVWKEDPRQAHPPRDLLSDLANLAQPGRRPGRFEAPRRLPRAGVRGLPHNKCGFFYIVVFDPKGQNYHGEHIGETRGDSARDAPFGSTWPAQTSC